MVASKEGLCDEYQILEANCLSINSQFLTLWTPISPLGGKFKPIQVHFHWGRDDDVGSEHTVNGSQYSAEVEHDKLLVHTSVLITKFVRKEKSDR